jgi:hypothetical protein
MKTTIVALLFATGITLLAARPAAAQAGGIELRIQSSSSIGAGGALFGLVLAPGVTYSTEAESLILNLSAGAGYLVSPTIVVGADAGVTIIDVGEDTAKFFTLAPYLKLVTGVRERESGFFVESTLGFTIADFGDAADESEKLLQLGLWGGGHFFLGRSSAALVVGPYLSYLRNVSSDVADPDNVLIGLKFGLSAYLL